MKKQVISYIIGAAVVAGGLSGSFQVKRYQGE